MRLFACLTALAALLCGEPAMPAEAAAGALETVKRQGVSVAFNIQPATQTAGKASALRAGEYASVRFNVEDDNHRPLSGLYPAAWIHPGGSGESDQACVDKVKSFIGGSLLSRAELDLNVYSVLTLNQDASISVVDPLFGFGGSKLLTMLPLNATGFDWTVSAAHDRVFVSLPATDEIAEINTGNWQISHHSANGQWRSPSVLSLQSGLVWGLVESGVAVFDQQPFALKQVIKTQSKPSALEFSGNGRFAYVLAGNRLNIIDARSLSLVKTLELTAPPVSMDYAALADELYISHAKSGEIWAVDGQKHTLSKVIHSQPGIAALRFAPNGRWGFLLNPLTDQLSIIDAAKQTIVQSGRVEHGPHSVAFSDQLAYLSHSGSFNLLMIALDDPDLGREGAAIPTIDTPGGDQPPGLIDLPSGGESIVQAPGSNAVLLSNYRDKAVYFYKEGMAAPMGQFDNYGKSPRAVLAIDHSLKERETPGTYSTSVVLPAAGDYQAIYFMDSPRVVHCFSFQVTAGQATAASQQTPQNQVDRLIISQTGTVSALKAGKTATLTFHVENEAAGGPLKNKRVDATVLLASGIWRQRLTAEIGQDGKLLLEFTPPLSGSYDVYLTPETSGESNAEKFSYEVTR